MTTRNTFREISTADLAALGIEDQAEGLEVGVYEIFDSGDEIELIDTGLLSVNCRCLIVAQSEEQAQELIDQTDPAASGCDDTHFWLPTMSAAD